MNFHFNKFLRIFILSFFQLLYCEIIINEINYHSSDDFHSDDWVEFYNYSNEDIDISNWEFRDENDLHVFVFPENTIMFSDEFLVLCKHDSAFTTNFPSVDNYLGNMGFGLSGGGEPIRLFNNNNVLIDSVNYDDEPPWTITPDGNGPTLELLHPSLDNLIPENWSASSGFGSPGQQNTAFLNIDAEFNPLKHFEILGNYPNPFNSNTTFMYNVNSAENLEINAFNLNGKLVQKLFNGYQSTGIHEIEINLNHQTSGVYLIQISRHSKNLTHKTLLLK